MTNELPYILEMWEFSPDGIFDMWDRVFNMYEMYHSEAIENAFADINRMIEKADEN